MTQNQPNNRAEFEAVAMPFMGLLYHTARRLTGQPEDAADAVQETYLRAYRTFDNFRAGTNARAWLFTILYSVVINRRKKTRHDKAHVSLDEAEAELVQSGTGVEAENIALGKVTAPEVEAALGELPEPFRAAVLMVDVNELSYDEAAAALGCPVGTVRSRLFRARKLLSVSLQEFARRSGYASSEDL